MLNPTETSILIDQGDPETKPENRILFKLTRKVIQKCDTGHTKEIAGLAKRHKILSTIEPIQNLHEKKKSQKKHLKKEVRDPLLRRFYEECKSEPRDLFFFAAAIFDFEKVNEIIGQFGPAILNDTRDFNSVIVFVLKYADVSDAKFPECIRLLLDSGVDVNIPDFFGKVAFDLVSGLHDEHKQNSDVVDKLKEVAKKLKDKGVLEDFVKQTNVEFLRSFPSENDLQETNRSQHQLDKNRMFFWIAKDKMDKIEVFLKVNKTPKFDVNCDNGEYTLLQYATLKSDRMHKIVSCLLKNKADPNKTTQLNKQTPLEIAAKKNHEQIFTILIKDKSLKISKDHFNNLVKFCSGPKQRNIFKLLLESDKVDPNFTFEKTKNTPLHYAIFNSFTDAIQKLLKTTNPCFFIAPNVNGKTILNTINSTDLKIHFDNCLVSDSYSTLDSIDCKMLLRFNFFVSQDLTTKSEPSKSGGNSDDSNRTDEISTLEAISKTERLEDFLTHPLTEIYINLKWSKVSHFYFIALLIQFVLFALLSISFYSLTESKGMLSFCIILLLINIVIKAVAFGKPKSIKVTQLYEDLNIYIFFEILLISTLLLTLFFPDYCAFAFIEMSILFLLTVGYHPKIAKWSVMLQTVILTFSKLMLFFSLILIACGAAFHVLFKASQKEMYGSLLNSFFMTYIMTTGEFNSSEYKGNSISQYILFFIFAMFVHMVISNFWTGVAVADIDRIEKYAKVNAFKNIIIFLVFVEKNYYYKRLKGCFPDFLLFPEPNTPHHLHFYVNRDNQFKDAKNYPQQIGKTCLEQVRNLISEREESKRPSREQTILQKLDDHGKTLKILLDAHNATRPKAEGKS